MSENKTVAAQVAKKEGQKAAADKAAADKAAADKAAAEDKGKKSKTPAEQFQEAKKGAKTKVEFIASPTGLLKLAHNVGDVAEFTEGQADFLADLKLAKKV